MLERAVLCTNKMCWLRVSPNLLDHDSVVDGKIQLFHSEISAAIRKCDCIREPVRFHTMRRIIKIHNSNKHLEFKSDEKYFDAGVERESSEIGS